MIRALYHAVGQRMGSHGLSDEGAQHSYTSLLVNWMSEMVQGARVSDKIAPTNTPTDLG